MNSRAWASVRHSGDIEKCTVLQIMYVPPNRLPLFASRRAVRLPSLGAEHAALHCTRAAAVLEASSFSFLQLSRSPLARSVYHPCEGHRSTEVDYGMCVKYHHER